MIILSPTTDEQEFNITPRRPSELSSITLTITEDGSGTTETFTDVTAYEIDDWIAIAQAFTILKNERLYTIEMLQDGTLWWRGVARCTDQPATSTTKHTLNATADGEFTQLSDDDDFQIIY